MNFAEYNVKDANLEEVLLALKSLDTVEAVVLKVDAVDGRQQVQVMKIRTTIFMFTVLKFRQPKQEKISSENTVRLQNSAIIIGRARTTRL